VQIVPLVGRPTSFLYRPHDCAIYCFPPTPLFCNTHHTILTMEISCKGQSVYRHDIAASPRHSPKGGASIRNFTRNCAVSPSAPRCTPPCIDGLPLERLLSSCRAPLKVFYPNPTPSYMSNGFVYYRNTG